MTSDSRKRSVVNPPPPSRRACFLVSLLTVLVVFGGPIHLAFACPLCSAPTVTWAEMIDDADITLLVELVSVDADQASQTAESTFRILSVRTSHPGVRPLRTMSPGRTFTLPEYVTGDAGDRFLLLGNCAIPAGLARGESTPAIVTADSRVEDATAARQSSAPQASIRTISFVSPEIIEWSSVSRMSQTSLDYILQAPAEGLPVSQRLLYYVQHLESPDPVVAADAWGEFARADYREIVAIRDELPREHLRRWIADPDMAPERLCLYSLLLGMCGDADDAEFLKEQIGLPSDGQIRNGVEGLISAYLVLQGESGLQWLEESWIASDRAQGMEYYAVMTSLQFMHDYEFERIPQDRVCRALYPLLGEESVRELAIANLSRWDHWSVIPRLELLLTSPDIHASSILAMETLAETCIRAAESGRAAPDDVAAAERLQAACRRKLPADQRESIRSRLLPNLPR